jgi:allophanate hydrolase
MSTMFQLAVAGAHLTGLPLNYQLTELGAKLVRTVRTAPVYSKYRLQLPTPAAHKFSHTAFGSSD